MGVFLAVLGGFPWEKGPNRVLVCFYLVLSKGTVNDVERGGVVSGYKRYPRRLQHEMLRRKWLKRAYFGRVCNGFRSGCLTEKGM